MPNNLSDPQHILLTAQRGSLRWVSDMAVGCALTCVAIWALATLRWSNVGWNLFAIIVASFSAAVTLYSGLYPIWGQLRVDVDDGWCTATWILGPYRRSERFRQADIRRIVRVNDLEPRTPAGQAGWQLSVDVAWRKRPIRLGGGLQLTEAMLEALEQTIGPEHPRQMFER